MAKVEFYKNCVLLATDAAAPYQVADAFADGAQNGAVAYTAKAFDAAGNPATSAPANISVNISAPVARLRGSWGFTARLSYGVVVFEPYVLTSVTQNPAAPGEYLLCGRNADQDGSVVAAYAPTQSFDLLDATDQTLSYERFYTFTFYPDDQDDGHGCYYGIDRSTQSRSACFPFQGVRDKAAPLGTASVEQEKIPLQAVPEGDPILRRYARLKGQARP